MNTLRNIKLTEIEGILSKNPFYKKSNTKLASLKVMNRNQQISLSSIKLRNVELLRE